METNTLYRLVRGNALCGIIHLSSGSYLFRNDHGYEKGIWAWRVDGDYERATVHKWSKLPRGRVELFNLDNPPQTVTYQPLLN